MIHAYNEYFVPIIQEKLASMFELAVMEEHIEIDAFTDKFLSSPVCKAFEKADPVFISGKSANELLAIVLDNEPLQIKQGSYATPEYWVGWVLAYTQWYLNKPYSVIITAYPCSKLVHDYFPYHEMDITTTVDFIKKKLPAICPLKKLRQERKLSQSELSLLSGVSLRSIKAYEQQTVDIAKAQADTLYALAQTLHCSIEDLIQ